MSWGESKVGDRYTFSEECPKCFNQVFCYYAESSKHTEAKCAHCGMEFNIVMDFKLEEKSAASK